MAKHRRWSDKPKSDISSKDEETQKFKQEISLEKEPKDIKSIIVSGAKYIYIVVAAALLSGIFTPLIINAEISTVIFGILTVLFGMGGGILIFLSTKTQKFRSPILCAGLGIMVVSLIIIYELAGKSILL